MNDIERIKFLRAELNKLNHAYYVESTSLVSDYDYDMMMKELSHLELKHLEMYDSLSPSLRVGSDLTDGFEKVNHKFPMLSISNSYSISEIKEFRQRIWNIIGVNENLRLVAEIKFDGLSISLIYINRRLVKAVTRGDGDTGDNVIENIKTIKSIPLTLTNPNIPDYFEVRGEVVLPRAEFIRINKEKIAAGEKPYANPRNTASGTLKLHSPQEVAARKLDAYFYEFLIEEGNSIKDCEDSHEEKMHLLKSLSFKIHPMTVTTTSIDELEKFINGLEVEKPNLPFDIDGVVIKVDNITIRSELGFRSNSPRWATAFKFKTERAETTLHSVFFQVGRTGVITPVGYLEPVELCQTVVKKATLNNFDWISEMDIRVGDIVYVEKGGEIIPKVVGVNLEKRPANAIPIEPPITCPECDAILSKEEGKVAYKCCNEFCSATSVGKIVHFASKDCMNIEGFGPAKIDQFVRKGFITKFSDIYKLDMSSILSIDRMAGPSANKLLKAIEASKNMPFEKVLYSLGIPKVGEVRVKRLVKRYKNIETLLSLNSHDLVGNDDIGYIIADAVTNYLEEIRPEIEELQRMGLCFSYKETKSSSNSLQGISVCITGTLSQSRPAFQKIIADNGGEFHKDVKKNTNFVLVGSEPGNGTLTAATKYSIQTIDESQFNKMLSNVVEQEEIENEKSSAEKSFYF